MIARDRSGPSRRERRLWFFAGLTVTGIVGSLVFRGSMTRVASFRPLLDVAFGVAFLAAIVAVATIALRRRRASWELGVILAVLASLAMTALRLGIPEERTHLFEYGLLAVLVYEALSERALRRGTQMPAALVAIVATGSLGWADEGVQALLPNRVYDLRDVRFNVFAATMAVAGDVALGRLRRRP